MLKCRSVCIPWRIQDCVHIFHFISYFWPVSNRPGCTSALGLLCYPSVHPVQVQQPCALYVKAEVSYWGCSYFFRFNKQIPKNIIALTSQRLAAASNVLHCFGLLPAESAGWVSIKQAQGRIVFVTILQKKKSWVNASTWPQLSHTADVHSTFFRKLRIT
jgi:hypothetical protein